MTEPGASVSRALAEARWSVRELWWACLTLGGSATEEEVSDFVWTGGPLNAVERDVLALALNQRLADVGRDLRVPYTADPAG